MINDLAQLVLETLHDELSYHRPLSRLRLVVIVDNDLQLLLEI
jgi:hypothetical protein